MKKLFYGMAALALFFTSCESEQTPNLDQEAQIDMSDFRVYTDANADEASKSSDNFKLNANRTCYTMPNLNRLLSENPGLEKRMYDIEFQTRQFITAKKPTGTPGGGPFSGGGGGGGNSSTDSDGDGIDDNVDLCPDTFGYSQYNGCPGPNSYSEITIPVVVNIIEQYTGQVTQDQIDSQENILNDDFHNFNTKPDNFPSFFSPVAANFNILFDIVEVNRKNSNKNSWGTRDAMKFSSKGGIDATDTTHNLNIWVCVIGQGILGYAQFPGGPEATDGVVIDPNYFGATESTNYGSGRTATHEIGHWLNLRHIWGDGGCSYDDYVYDTPISDGPNYGCPDYPTVHCNTADMTMNYMDYTYDDCMYMFTFGQNDRAHAIFALGGYRDSFVP